MTHVGWDELDLAGVALGHCIGGAQPAVIVDLAAVDGNGSTGSCADEEPGVEAPGRLRRWAPPGQNPQVGGVEVDVCFLLGLARSGAPRRSLLVVWVGWVEVSRVYPATREHPGTAGEGELGVPLEHQRLQSCLAVAEQDGGRCRVLPRALPWRQ